MIFSCKLERLVWALHFEELMLQKVTGLRIWLYHYIVNLNTKHGTCPTIVVGRTQTSMILPTCQFEVYKIFWGPTLHIGSLQIVNYPWPDT